MTYVMSDIHGMKNMYDEMLDKIKFSNGDVLYVVGDTIDRGPDGIPVLMDLMSRKNAVLVRGNHEEMLLNALNPLGTKHLVDVWANNGSPPTIRGLNELGPMQKARLHRYVKKTPTSLDVEAGGRKFHLVHACPGKDDRTRLWERPSQYAAPMFPDRTVIVGHTPTMYFHPSSSTYLTKAPGHMEIYRCDAFIGIDCGCAMPWNIPKRALGCLRLEDMEEYYVEM